MFGRKVDKELVDDMMLPLGTASPELAEAWNSIAREARRTDAGNFMEIACAGRTIYTLSDMPARACVEPYIIGSKPELGLLELLGEFSYPDEPYMLVDVNGRAGKGKGCLDMLDEIDLEALGAKLVYDVRRAPLEPVDGRGDAYRYTGSREVDQDIIDEHVYSEMMEYAKLERESIESAFGLRGPAASRAGALENRIAAFFDVDATFGGTPVSEMLERHISRASQQSLTRGPASPRLVFGEEMASDGIGAEAERMMDLYALASYLVESAMGRGIEIRLDEWMSDIGTARELRRFAEDEGWDSMIESYNSGVDVQDIIA